MADKLIKDYRKDLSVRTYNCLWAANMHEFTVKELAIVPKSRLMKIRNFGKHSLLEVGQFLKVCNQDHKHVNISDFIKEQLEIMVLLLESDDIGSESKKIIQERLNQIEEYVKVFSKSNVF